MTKQQLLALLREAYRAGSVDEINCDYDDCEFIAEIEHTNRVGDLELPVLESEWPDESRIDAIGQNGGDGAHYSLVPHEFYD